MAVTTKRRQTLETYEPVYARAAATAIRPLERMGVPEWMERYHKIPKEAALPGNFSFDNTPWLRGIAEALDPSHPAQEIVFVKPTQIGATELGNGWIGYCIERKPCMMLQVQPTLDMAKRYSRTKIAPMIRNNPILHKKVSPERSRDGSNTILGKTFLGGAFFMTGANSAVGLRMVSARFLFTDERTGYPVDLDGEGNPFLIVKKRTDTFGRKAKVYSPSTPTIKGESVINDEYDRSDRRKFFIPCPKCGEFQVMVWDQVKWPSGKPILAEYECIDCSRMWDNGLRIDATRAGEWVGEIQWEWPMPVGFWINGLYSHFKTLGERAVEYIDSRKSREDYKTFVNTVLAEPWEETGEYETSAESIARCSERYEFQVPDGVQVLTAGVDVQDNRLEIEVLGFGHERETWQIEHSILPGDPTSWPVFEDLYNYLGQSFQGRDKPFYIQSVCVDAGHRMTEVLQAVRELNRRRPAQKIYGIKGSADPMIRVWPKHTPTRRSDGTFLWTINVSTIKDTVYSRLKDAEEAAGGHTGLQLYHFRHDNEPEYYRQLMSERKVPKFSKGRRQRSMTGQVTSMWVPKPGVRQEVLDTVVYAHSALEAWLSLSNRFEASVAPQRRPQQSGGAEPVAEKAPTSQVEQQQPRPVPPAPQPIPQRQPARRARSRWMGRIRF